MQTSKVIMSIIDLCNNVMYSFANLVVASTTLVTCSEYRQRQATRGR